MRLITTFLASLILYSGFAQVNFYTEFSFTEEFGQYSKSQIEKSIMNVLLKNQNGDQEAHRFVLLCEPIIIDYTTTNTAPPLNKIEMGLSIIIGDNFTKTKFSSLMIENLIGVDANPEKAIIQACKTIRRRKDLNDFINESTQEIIKFYDSKSQEYIDISGLLVQEQLFDSALVILSYIPSFSDSAFKTASNLKSDIISKKIDFQCESVIKNIQSLLASDKYEEASSLIFAMPPSKICDEKIEKYLLQIEKHYCTLKVNEAFAAWATKDMEKLQLSMSVIDDNSPCKMELSKLKDNINKVLTLEAKQKHDEAMQLLKNQKIKDDREYLLSRDIIEMRKEQMQSNNSYRMQELRLRQEMSKDHGMIQKERIRAAESIAIKQLSTRNTAYLR